MLLLKSPRLALELARASDALRELIVAVVEFVDKRYGKNVTLSEIWRSQEEQDEIYNDNPLYQKDPWKSTHQFYRAVDIRTRGFTEEERRGIKAFIRLKFPYDPARKNIKSALYGDKAHKDHIHAQVLRGKGAIGD